MLYDKNKRIENKNNKDIYKDVSKDQYGLKIDSEYPYSNQIIIKIAKSILADYEAIKTAAHSEDFKKKEDNGLLSGAGELLQKSIISCQINESIAGNFDTCQMTFKIPIKYYQNTFGDGLDKIQTGQYIIIQKQTYLNTVQSLISNINNDNLEKFKQNLEIKKVIENTALPRGRTSVDAQTQPSRPKNNIDYLEEYKQLELKTRLDKLKKAAEAENINNDLDKHSVGIQTIFLGFITNITSEFEIDPGNGNPLFNVTLNCQSFIYPLQSNEILYGNSSLKYTQLGDYSQVKEFKYTQFVNAIFKNGEYWEKFASNFLSRTNKVEKENLEIKTVDVRNTIRNIIWSFSRNVLPQAFYAGLKNEQEIFRDPIDGSDINPGGYPTLGLLINVVTQQEHLPMNSTYRKFLPIHSPWATVLNGFKSALGSNSNMQTWSLITGTFLTDPALFELFPALIPITNYTELELKLQKNQLSKSIKQFYSDQSKFQPEFNPGELSDLIYNMWIKLGAIPCVIFRWKLLNPEFALNQKTYSNLISQQGLFNTQYLSTDPVNQENAERLDKLIAASKIPFKSEKLHYIPKDQTFLKAKDAKEKGLESYPLNHDVCLTDNLPVISAQSIVKWTQQNNEDENINIVDVIPPRGGANIGSGSDNSSIGIDERSTISLYNIMLKGPKILRSEYPLWDHHKALGNEFLGVVAERLFSIYGEGNKQQRGEISISGIASYDILKGCWLRISLTSKDNDCPPNLRKYYDYYAYVESITRNHMWDPNNGNYVATTTISYSRGKFGLMPPTFPDSATNRKSSSNNIENMKEQKGLTPNGKNSHDTIKEIANNIERGESVVYAYETYSERMKEQMGPKVWGDYIKGGYAKHIKDNYKKDIKTRTQLKNARLDLINTKNRSIEQERELEFYETLLYMANTFEIDLNVTTVYPNTTQQNKSKIKVKKQ